MAKWMAAAKKAREWTTACKIIVVVLVSIVFIVCPNVTGRTNERIAQSKRVRADSLAKVD